MQPDADIGRSVRLSEEMPANCYLQMEGIHSEPALMDSYPSLKGMRTVLIPGPTWPQSEPQQKSKNMGSLWRLLNRGLNPL